MSACCGLCLRCSFASGKSWQSRSLCCGRFVSLPSRMGNASDMKQLIHSTRLLIGEGYVTLAQETPALTMLGSEVMSLLGELAAASASALPAKGTALLELGYELDRSGQKEAAESVYRQTIDTLEALSYRKQSSLSAYQLAKLALFHGKNLFLLSRFEQAAASFRRTVEIFDSLSTCGATHALVCDLSIALCWLGRTKRISGRHEEAATTYRRAAKLLQTVSVLAPGKHDSRRCKQFLAMALLGQAKSLRLLGKSEKAAKLNRRAKVLFSSLHPELFLYDS